MVKFEYNNQGLEVFTTSIRGDRQDYLNTIKTLLFVMGRSSETDLSQDDIFYMCNLIEGMLPESNIL